MHTSSRLAVSWEFLWLGLGVGFEVWVRVTVRIKVFAQLVTKIITDRIFEVQSEGWSDDRRNFPLYCLPDRDEE